MKVIADVDQDNNLSIQIQCSHPATVANVSIDQIVDAIVDMIERSRQVYTNQDTCGIMVSKE